MSPALALALEALHRIAEFDEHEWAGPAKRDALATIAAIAALKAETEGPYAWTVDASTRMWFGDYAEDDAGAEAAHCGGTCKAFPLYKGAPA